MKILRLTVDEIRNVADGVDNDKINNKLEHHNIRVQELIRKIKKGQLALTIYLG